MSYILDALKRAESERERGAVPGLLAQPVPAATVAAPGAARVRVLGLAVLVLTLALAGLLAWTLLGRPDAPMVAAAPATAAAPVPASQAAPAAVPALPAPAPATLATAAPPAQRMPAVPPAPADPSPRPERPVKPFAKPGTDKPMATKAASEKTAGARLGAEKPGSGKASPATIEPKTVEKADAAPAARLPTAQELPEELRRDLPKLVVGGSVYSAAAASRFVILNGLIWHEGDTVASELVLEQIELRAAVLRFRGQRFRLGF